MWNSTFVRGNRGLYSKLIAIGLLVFLFLVALPSYVLADEAPHPQSDNSLKRKPAEPDQASGAFLNEYPILIPPGRNGFEPDLKLVYNSQSRDASSLFGQGWSITIPSIERFNKTGIENIYSGDTFISSLTGELVSLGGGVFASKIDNGEFLTYTFSDNAWQVADKKGTIYTFGLSQDCRQNDPDSPDEEERTFKWMLEEVRDTNDNFIRYEYYKDQGQIYPSKIFYTGHGSTDGIFTVEFSRETRTDTNLSSHSGFSVKTIYRINEIQTKISNTLAKKYILDYSTGDNDTTSILTSVTEEGKDESAASTTLPATTFEYQATPNQGHWQSDTSTWTAPFHVYHGTGSVVGDINGDGYDDIMKSWFGGSGSGTWTKSAYLSDGNGGFTLSEAYEPPFIFMYVAPDTTLDDEGVRLLDLNGDGLLDLFRGTVSPLAYLNNGNGWTEDDVWDSITPIRPNNVSDDMAFIANINGDNLPDIIYTDLVFNGTGYDLVTTTRINTGEEWEEVEDVWESPIYLHASNGIIFIDINGDGLDDIVKGLKLLNSTEVKKSYINNGHGQWIEESAWAPPTVITVQTSSNYDDAGARFVDFNGDGLPDLVQSGYYGYPTTAWINDGSGWVEDSNWEVPTVSFADIDPTVFWSGVNGDSSADVFYTTIAGSSYQTHVYKNKEKRSNLLKKINYSEGGSTTITYKATPQYKSGSTLLNPDLFLTLDTVETITTADGLGNSDTTTYSYEGGSYYYNNPHDAKFAGFGKVTATDSRQKVVSFFHQGNSTNSSQGEYDDQYAKIGKKYREEIRDLSNNLFSVVINKWDMADLDDDRSFVKLAQTLESTYDGNTSHKDKATAYTYSDTTGNIATITNWGVVTGSDNGTFTDTGSDKFTTTLTYASNTSDQGVIGLLSKESTANQSSTMVKETKMYYDAQSWGNATLGNQTKVEEWVQVGDPYTSQQKAYNSYGLVTSETDPRGKVISFSYDSYNLYPTTVTNPLSQATTFTYDYSSGAVKQTTDPNGSVYTTVYDGLDRPIEEKIPNVSGSGQVTKATHEYTDTTGEVRTKTRTYLDSSNIIDTYIYFDGLHRKIQERSETATSNQFSVRDFIYSNGLLLKESLPYFSSGTSQTTATTDADLYTSYTYDALNRIKTAVTTVGTTTTDYNDWKTTITDPTSKVKDVYRDAYDNLIQVDEHKDASTYTTSYEYNVLKKLTKITDAAGNVRNFTYDGIGNVLSAQDLHAPSDTTFGTYSYSYDEAGNKTSQTDPNSQTINYTYDDINRVLTENYTGESGTEVTYEYDTCSNGIGHICEVNNPESTTTYNYNKLGQRSTEAMSIGSEDFSTSYTYDRQGNQLMINNPDYSQIQYLYDASGLVNEIKHKEDSDANFSDVISSITYNPVGLIDMIEYHNGSSTTNTYDAEELYRLRHKVTTAGDDDIQNLTYTYDPVGNIEQIIDASDTETAKTTDYTYDDLNRLATSEISEAENPSLDGPNEEQAIQDFTYDSIGNIDSSPEAGEYSYLGSSGSNYANPHAVTETDGGYTLTYDHNGNITSSELDDDTTTYTWDYNNRLVDIEKNEESFLYAYDTTGQRIKAETPSNTFYYPTKYFTSADDVIEKHIFLGDTAVASVKGSNYTAEVFTIHSDHLTGSNVLTDENEDISQILDYYSFGTVRLDNQIGGYNETRKFTGHEYDEETGLTYMEARYYDAKLGRFLSQDPKFNYIETQNTEFPQQINSYSYVNNNPLRYIDLDGREGIEFQHVMNGFNNAYYSNYAFGLGRTESSNQSFRLGQNLGDAISFTQGALEIASGAITTSGGIAISTTGVGAIAGAPATALGAGLIGHGSLLIGSSAYQLSKNLSSEEKNTDVYIGQREGESVYTGISNNVSKRVTQHGARFDNVKKITTEPLTRSEARGVEQALIEKNPQFENKINSISPQRSIYQQAVEFGKKFLISIGLNK